MEPYIADISGIAVCDPNINNFSHEGWELERCPSLNGDGQK